MELNEQKSILKSKNDLIIRQTRRIEMLEKRLMVIRKEYFRLKYSDVSSQLRNIGISSGLERDLSE